MTQEELKTELERLARVAAEAFPEDPRAGLIRLASEYTPTAPDAPEWQIKHDRQRFITSCRNVIENF